MAGEFIPNNTERVWRIIRAIGAFQILGGLIGVVIAYHHFWFFNLWLGGAIGTLPGYVVGYVWQNRQEPETRSQWIGTAVFLGLFAIAFVAIGVSSLLPTMVGEMRRIAELQQFDKEELLEIEVFDGHGLERICTIDDPDVLSAFARAITDAEGYSRSDRETSRSWYLIVRGSKRREFDLRTSPSFPDNVIGNFVSRTRTSHRNYGAFSSHAMRTWVEDNLP